MDSGAFQRILLVKVEKAIQLLGQLNFIQLAALVGCGTLASALCMDKVRAHQLAAAAGVEMIPPALLRNPQHYQIVFGRIKLPGHCASRL